MPGNVGDLPFHVSQLELMSSPGEGGLLGAGFATSGSMRFDVGASLTRAWTDCMVENLVLELMNAGVAATDLSARVQMDTGVCESSGQVGIEHLPFWKEDMSAEFAKVRREAK